MEYDGIYNNDISVKGSDIIEELKRVAQTIYNDNTTYHNDYVDLYFLLRHLQMGTKFYRDSSDDKGNVYINGKKVSRVTRNDWLLKMRNKKLEFQEKIYPS